MKMSRRPSFISTHRENLPAVPLRDMVVFPHMMAPFIVGRAGSVRALEESLARGDRNIFLIAQRDPKVDEPGQDDMHRIGVVARIVQNLRLPNGNVKVMVEGVQRAELMELVEDDGAFSATVEVFDVDLPTDAALEKYMERVLTVFEQYAKMSQHLAFEGLASTIMAYCSRKRSNGLLRESRIQAKESDENESSSELYQHASREFACGSASGHGGFSAHDGALHCRACGFGACSRRKSRAW